MIEARKLPAAPALYAISAIRHFTRQKEQDLEIYPHYEVDAPKSTDTFFDCRLQALYVPDIHRS